MECGVIFIKMQMVIFIKMQMVHQPLVLGQPKVPLPKPLITIALQHAAR